MKIFVTTTTTVVCIVTVFLMVVMVIKTSFLWSAGKLVHLRDGFFRGWTFGLEFLGCGDYVNFQGDEEGVVLDFWLLWKR